MKRLIFVATLATCAGIVLAVLTYGLTFAHAVVQ